MIYVVVMVVPILFGAAEVRVLAGTAAFESETACRAAAHLRSERDEQRRRFTCQPMTMDRT